MRQRGGGRAEKIGVQTHLRAGLITQHTVDTHGILLEFGQFGGCLAVFLIGQRARFFVDDVGFDRLELFDKRIGIHNQIFFDGKLIKRAHGDFAHGGVIAHKGGAGEFGFAVDHHAARAAHFHTARPAVGQLRFEIIFHQRECVQNRHVMRPFDIEHLRPRFFVDTRAVTHHFQFDGMAHDFFSPSAP